MDKFRLTECQTLDIPVGNDVPLLVKLVKGFDGCDGEGAVPFPIDVCENVVVAMVSERGQVKSVAHRLGTDGKVLLELQAADYRAGLTYGIDVRATLNGKAVHAYGKSLVRITAATERGPRQVAQAADPYEVTLQVGYVGDLIPRRLDELEGYDELMDEVDGKADAAEVDEALAAVGREFQKYIPVAHKAVAGGVASLNGEKKVPTDQLQFPLRGQLTPSQIDSTSLADGVYQVNGKVISPDILGGAQANGVLVQYPWDSRVQTLFVGRAAAHADGEQVEIYTRRYLPTPKRWTAWMRIDGGGGGVAELMIPVAWAELVGMRDRGELVPGMQYRITDYVATTTQAETQSANRPFDIIVTADSATTLSEWARATHHDGCDSASDPFWNSRLNQWLLRYSLDNDKGRYGWADPQNGKGVVYWMRDEWGNEMPFDFKGILFYHVNFPYVVNGGDYYYYYYYYALSKQLEKDYTYGHAEINDASLDGTARRNVVKPYFVDGVQMLNRVIFGIFDEWCVTPMELGNVIDNIIEDGCHDFCCIEDVEYVAPEGHLSCVKHIRVNRETMPERRTYYVGVFYVAFSERTYGYPEDENTTYTLKKSGTKIILEGSDGSSSEVTDADTKLTAMTQTEANTGTSTTARSLTPKVLKAAIEKHAPAPDLSPYALKEDTLAQFKVGEEVLVGEWTEDGVTYDLYRKVVSFGALPNAGQKTVAHGIADKVKFVGVSAMASNGFPIPFPTQDTGKNIYVALGNNLITINTHATDRSSLTADVTILFTRNKPV